MTRLPGDLAINHGGIGWVEPASNPPLRGSGFERLMENINKRAPRAPRLVLRRRPAVFQVQYHPDAPVTHWRPDGWPLCPWCGEDELAAINASHPSPHAVNLCYRCGPVEVVTFEAAAVSAR